MPDATDLQSEILDILRWAILNDPRTLQRNIGPSGLGTPCVRKLVYQIGHYPEANPRDPDDLWHVTVGRAVHVWIADVLTDHNRRHGERFLVENRINCGEYDGIPLDGTADAYDLKTATVLDWKNVGTTTLTDARRHGPSPTYRTQVMLYGYGLNEGWGLPVENVCIAYLPIPGGRLRRLSDLHWHTEPYDASVALSALARADALSRAHRFNNTVAALAPATDDHCATCPFRVSESPDPAAGRCPGSDAYLASSESTRSRAVKRVMEGLIA